MLIRLNCNYFTIKLKIILIHKGAAGNPAPGTELQMQKDSQTAGYI
jgi:hypothetical protein